MKDDQRKGEGLRSDDGDVENSTQWNQRFTESKKTTNKIKTSAEHLDDFLLLLAFVSSTSQNLTRNQELRSPEPRPRGKKPQEGGKKRCPQSASIRMETNSGMKTTDSQLFAATAKILRCVKGRESRARSGTHGVRPSGSSSSRLEKNRRTAVDHVGVFAFAALSVSFFVSSSAS